jgi:predicted kinase/ribosomal protein L32
MMNVCSKCGSYRPDKVVDPSGAYAICPECGHQHRFLRLPLVIVSGASGTGKSTVCHELLGRLTDVVLLDADILWRPEFAIPGASGPNFFETWLRVAKSISQSGRPVALFGAGMGVPENLELCVERRYFSDIQYLALVCSDDVLAERLRSRPEWRQSHADEFVEGQIRFNRWFRERKDLAPAIDLLDTTSSPAGETAEKVAEWIRRKIH